MSRPLAKLALAVLVLVAALATATSASVSGAATANATAKKCPKGRVLVKVNKRSSCKPVRSAFPRAKRGDRTLINFKAGLVDVTKLKGRNGKRARKLPPRAAAGAKVARKKFLRALPKLLRMLEERAGSPARASAVNCGGPGSAQPASEAGKTDGVGVQPLAGPRGEEGGVMTVPLNGYRYEMTFIQCGSKGYYVLGCPKSNGDAPTSAKSRYTTTQRIFDGKKLISSSSSDTTHEDKLLGKVEDTARLKYFDFTRQEQTLTVATGGVVTGGKATRTLRVNMPSGSYDAAHSKVAIAADPGTFKEEDLAASIAMAKEEYTAAENGGSFLHTDGWATFERQRDPYCAKAVFSPDSETLKLKKSQQNQVSLYARGSDGGRATGARWEFLDQQNAIFNGASGANPSIGYTVSAAPAGDRVRVTVKFTSTAGVGKDTWTQPIGELPTINRLTGTFSGSYSVPTILGASTLTWTGTAVYDRMTPGFFGGASGQFQLVSGGYDMTASGIDGSGGTACQQKGTKHFDLGGPGSGYFQIDSVDLGSFDPPYAYSLNAMPVGPQWMDITRHSCPPGAESEEGTTSMTIYFPPAVDTAEGVSDDGIVYNGSTNETQGGVTVVQNWNFTGTE